MPAHSSPTKAAPGTISWFTGTCIVVANMVGTGVFTSLGFQVGGLPSPGIILLLWVLGGVCALFGALAYAELATALPRSGGEYHFLSKIYHPAVGFTAGWLSITAGFSVPVALAAMAFGKYFGAVVPGVPPLVLSLAVVFLVTLAHVGSIKFSSLFQNTATVLKVFLILILMAAGFSLAQPRGSGLLPATSDWSLVGSNAFAVSLIYVMYAYSGWNACVYIVGEMRHLKRDLPLALTGGTFLVMLLYIGLNAMFLRVAPLAALEGQLDVGHVAAAMIFGTAGGKVMSAVIGLGLVATISAMMWIGPRVAATMGEDSRPLQFLAQRSSQGVPVTAMILQFLVVVVLLLTTTFDVALTYLQFSLNLMCFMAVLGVIILRWRQPALPRPYLMWGYPWTALVFLGISLWMMVNVLWSRPWESLAGLATLGVGWVVYFLSPPTRVPVSSGPAPDPPES